MSKTYALYKSKETNTYHWLDITDLCETMDDDAGMVMSAAIATSVVSLATKGDGEAFYWGDAEGCSTELLEMLNRVEPDKVVLPHDHASYKKYLCDHGWSLENTGGNTMVWFKDFVCLDGIDHLVGIDGENEDGGVYNINYDQWCRGTDYDFCDSSNDCKLLEQYQVDEIATANIYAGYYFDQDIN